MKSTSTKREVKYPLAGQLGAMAKIAEHLVRWHKVEWRLVGNRMLRVNFTKLTKEWRALAKGDKKQRELLDNEARMADLKVELKNHGRTLEVRP